MAERAATTPALLGGERLGALNQPLEAREGRHLTRHFRRSRHMLEIDVSPWFKPAARPFGSSEQEPPRCQFVPSAPHVTKVCLIADPLFWLLVAPQTRRQNSIRVCVPVYCDDGPTATYLRLV